MGANTFITEARGSTAQEAFDSAVAAAQYDHGHGGYTGTIAEKHDFVKIATVDTLAEAEALADKIIDACDPRIDDKWGPAGCINIRDGAVHFLFFGWASS